MFILFIVFFTYHTQVYSVTLKAELNAGNLRWNNASMISKTHLIPLEWDIANKLNATKIWIPGGLVSSVKNIKLANEEHHVILPLEVVGFEYNTDSIIFTHGQSEMNSCADVSFSSSTIRLIGDIDCNYTHQLENTTAYPPYSSIRPIFAVNEMALISAFYNKPQGVYLGSTSAESFYYFYNGAVVDIGQKNRKHQQHLIDFEINHVPDAITSVYISGKHEIAMNYDKNNRISGQASLSGLVRGWLDNQVKMKLKSQKAYELALVGSNTHKFPYSIDCIGCTISNLVDTGYVVNDTTKLVRDDSSDINFELKISYQDVDTTELDVGYYQDTVVLIFEPDV